LNYLLDIESDIEYIAQHWSKDQCSKNRGIPQRPTPFGQALPLCPSPNSPAIPSLCRIFAAAERDLGAAPCAVDHGPRPRVDGDAVRVLELLEAW